MENRNYEPSVRPSLDDDGEIRIVKLIVDFIEYDGMYDNGWWIHYGGLSVGYREIDEYEITSWSY